MNLKTVLGLIAVAAIGGGAYYLYKAGQLVSAGPEMGSSVPAGANPNITRMMRIDPSKLDAAMQMYIN